MLHLDCIGIEVKSQGYEGRGIQVSPDEQEAVLIMEKRTGKRSCPKCGQPSYINGIARMQLKDVPIIAGCKQSLLCLYHQYQCPKCGKTFKDEVPFAYPGTRITQRAAGWIRMLLANWMSVRAIQQITGIHWDTIHKVYKEMVDTVLEERERCWKEENYRPRFLAVDEFAIHKGHSYATCVLDLESGEVLWVGKGRAIADFARFFEEIDSELLSCVEAVAMDMNASYNLLVREHLPDAQIVYDRFHMQAQFGKEVHQKARAVPGHFLPGTAHVYFPNPHSISPLSLSRISISVPFTFLSTILSSSCSMKPSFTSVIGFLSMA